MGGGIDDGGGVPEEDGGGSSEDDIPEGEHPDDDARYSEILKKVRDDDEFGPDEMFKASDEEALKEYKAEQKAKDVNDPVNPSCLSEHTVHVCRSSPSL